MNINELFEEIQNEFLSEELNGEFQLEGGWIVWTHNYNEGSEDPNDDDYDEDNGFSFESITPEELMLDAYQEDIQKLEEFLDEINETNNWKFSDVEVNDDNVSFKIY